MCWAHHSPGAVYSAGRATAQEQCILLGVPGAVYSAGRTTLYSPGAVYSAVRATLCSPGAV